VNTDHQRILALELAVSFHKEGKANSIREHEDVLKTAKDFLNFLNPPVVATSVSIYFDAPTTEEGAPPMTALTDGQQIVAHVSELDSKGNAADEPGTWTVDRTDLVSVTPSADGLSCTFEALGGLGTAVVSLTVGSLPTATATLDIVAGDAASVNISFDDPTDESTSSAPAPSTGTTTPTEPPAAQ
jgi:hypothetical protein